MFRLRSYLTKELRTEKKTFQTREALVCSMCGCAVELHPLSMKFGDGKYLDKCAVLVHLANHVDEFAPLAREIEAPSNLSDWSDAEIDRGFALVTECNKTQSQTEAHSPDEAKARRGLMDVVRSSLTAIEPLVGKCSCGSMRPVQPSRNRRRSMARRYQQGSIETHGNWYVLRFRKDDQHSMGRIQVRERICPVSGPGRLSRGERHRRAESILQDAGVNSVQEFQRVNGATFREQAEQFLKGVALRKKKPVKAATLATWTSCLKNWLNPNLGDLPLASVGNAALKSLVARMYEAGLKPKSIHNYLQLAKEIVTSAVDENGDQLYPRKWNHDFIDAPEVVAKNQRQPFFDEAQLQQIIEKSTGLYRVLYTLLAATGLRIGEALGLNIANIDFENRIISVKESAYHSKIQPPKTSAAVRQVDFTKEVGEILKAFAGHRNGLLFSSGNEGLPHSQSNILRRHFHPLLRTLNIAPSGFHAFRRYRVTWLRKTDAPEDLVALWIGHAGGTITARYSKLPEDLKFRQETTEKLGVGFDVFPYVPNVTKSLTKKSVEKGV